MHFRPSPPDPGIEDRLLRKLTFPVYQQCVAKGFTPGLKRLASRITRSIHDFLDRFGEVVEEHADVPDHNHALLANYYEGNWNGEIEKAAAEFIIAQMRARKLKADKDSAPELIQKACGDELQFDS